jgi:hypothetical protein
MKIRGVSSVQSEVIGDSLIITGVARSGTSLVGKLIGSLKGIEYQYEPPTLKGISSLYVSGQLDTSTAKILLTIYLSEDLLLEAVQGRRANLRPSDYSMALNTISWPDLAHRWQELGNRDDALEWIKKNNLRLAVKIPNVIDSFELFNQVIPELQVVLVLRDGRDVVQSILDKKWMTDDSLKREMWPYSNFQDEIPVPYWVSKTKHEEWPHMTPSTRACMMWSYYSSIGHNLFINNSTSLITTVRYEDLVRYPSKTINSLSDKLGHDITGLTQDNLTDVEKRGYTYQEKSAPFESKVKSDVFNRFLSINSKWGYK